MTLEITTSVEARIKVSKDDFLGYVWPVIGSAFGVGKLIPAEGSHDELAKQLDYIGIDYLFIPDKGEPFGVSQRTCSGTWRTVTMSQSALDRLKMQWGRAGSLTPAIHVQSYLTESSVASKTLHSVAVVKLDHFMKYIVSSPGQRRTNHAQGTEFLAWDFDDLDSAGVTAITLPALGLRDPFGPAIREL